MALLEKRRSERERVRACLKAHRGSIPRIAARLGMTGRQVRHVLDGRSINTRALVACFEEANYIRADLIRQATTSLAPTSPVAPPSQAET